MVLRDTLGKLIFGKKKELSVILLVENLLIRTFNFFRNVAIVDTLAN